MLNQTLNELKLEKHPEKVLIGRIERGFDFIGYRFEPKGITLAKKAITNFINKALRLYEQEPPRFRTWRLGKYVSKWLTWAVAGLYDKNHLFLDGSLYLYSRA